KFAPTAYGQKPALRPILKVQCDFTRFLDFPHETPL
ncbi:hypothetical protein PSYJA_38551, partial [Pseudomonas syringae pv. japonica str. M301072]